MKHTDPVFRTMGDCSLLVELGDEISPTVNQSVQELFTAIDMQPIDGVRELVPSYRSLMVVYDPMTISPVELKRVIGDTYDHLNQTELPEPRTIEIPIVYGGEQGPDLEYVAQHHHLTPQEVIDFHSRPIYRVYMIGFTPGYPYLGEVPDAIATPRRETPRLLVPKGSVGIAQKQTGIYSVDSPGGWQIIGWTPVNLFDPQAQPPSLLMMGDRVRFQAVSAQDASQWQPKRP